jgi:hypothetical protein
VLRLLGDLDPVGRMARLLVEIRDPLGAAVPAKAPKEGEPPPLALPLLLGAYVEVGIEAQQLTNVVEVPRLALRGDDSVYVVGKDDRLEVRGVEIAWRRADTVLIKSGIAAGDRVITSRLPNAVPGMQLRVSGGGPTTALGRR